MTTMQLTTKQKQTLRKFYGEFKAIKMYDGSQKVYENRQEMFECKKEHLKYYTEEHPDLAEFFTFETIPTIPELAYSENQLKFIEEADEQGLDIDYDYSGRGMYGDSCPSVTVEHTSDFKVTANYRTDSMGMDVVMYAQY
jgi:hypothetical protein